MTMRISTLFEEQTAEDIVRSEAVWDSNLVRGLTNRSPTDHITKLPIRTDRNPLTATIASTILFNACFEAKFGIPDIRRRALFCTTSYEDAEEYGYSGSVVKVCPLKSSKMAYCPSVSDSMIPMEWLEYRMSEVFGNKMHKIMDAITAQTETTSHVTLNSLQVLKDAVIATIGETGEAMLEQYFNIANSHCMNDYVVTGAQPIPNKPEFGRMEVMIFDAPYYYAVREDGGQDD